MKRTEEALKKLIKIETRSVTREMLNEMACRILTQVCKSALVEATVVEIGPQVEHVKQYAGKKARSQIKIGPSTYLSDPLLLDIKEMIDEELSVLYPKPIEKSKSK